MEYREASSSLLTQRRHSTFCLFKNESLVCQRQYSIFQFILSTIFLFDRFFSWSWFSPTHTFMILLGFILLLSNKLPNLLKKGSEADLFLIDWYGKRALSKMRTERSYRHPLLDGKLDTEGLFARQRCSRRPKEQGIRSPCVYFLDTHRNEIIMEYNRRCKFEICPSLAWRQN